MTGDAGSRVSGAARAQRAESYLRLRAEQELATAVTQAEAQPHTFETVMTGRGRRKRFGELAGALAAVGAIPERTAVSVVEDLGGALLQRGLLEDREMDVWKSLPGATTAVRAVPAGVSAQWTSLNQLRFRIRLGVLVTDGQLTWVTYRAACDDPGPAWQGPDPSMALVRVTAADDLGGEHAGASGLLGGTQCRSEGCLWFDSAPAVAARWLDIAQAGSATVRIALDQPREHVVTAAALDPAGAADRYVDACSVTLLADDPVRLPGIVAMAAELLAAGVLQPGSPSLARLVAAAQRRGLSLPGPLAAISPAPLPDDWAELAGRFGTVQGATGVVFPAAVLPEVEGARCVITEAASRPDVTMLRVFAAAWPSHGLPATFSFLPCEDERYHWEVRDDIGHRYATSDRIGSGHAGGPAEFGLRLHPPVSPHARALEVTLSGRAAQASVHVPLDWQADEWEYVPDWQVLS